MGELSILLTAATPGADSGSFEWAMFIAFIVLFFLYAYSITKAWKITRWVRRMKRRARRNKQ